MARGVGPQVFEAGSENLRRMKDACRVASDALAYAGTLVQPGVTTDDIDRAVHAFLATQRGAYPSPLGYNGFPKSICTSVNEVACHGIPDDRPLAAGDIVNIDVTAYYRGFHGDTNATFVAGALAAGDATGRRLIDAARTALLAAVSAAGPQAPFHVIGNTIADVIQKHRPFCILPDFVGHGIGSFFHGPPMIYHHRNRASGREIGADKMLPGMTFTIEPIILETPSKLKLWKDGWTWVATTGARSAQFEHTILITEHGAEILT